MNEQAGRPSTFDEISIFMLSHGKSIRLRGSGTSMAPVIRDGSIITIDPVSTSPKWGDIVLFKTSHNRLLIHRVIALKPSRDGRKLYLMRGDANVTEDGWVSEDNILGIVNCKLSRLQPCRFNKIWDVLTMIWYFVKEVSKNFIRRW